MNGPRSPATRSAWPIVLIAALAAPPSVITRLLPGAFEASPADLRAGAWILKTALAVLALAAMLLRRPPDPEPSPPSGAGPVPRWEWLALGALVLVAAGLRLYRLDTELWMDEIFLRARYVPLEVGQLLSTYDTQNHQPFYTILARLAWLAAGGADWALRLPAVLFGVASVAAAWHFARRLGVTGAEAILAAAVLTASYHHVWFSQNARGYTAMLCLTIPATALFHALCRGEGRARRQAWAYAALMALATWTHLTAALIAVGHALALALTTRWTTAEGRRRALWPVTALALSALVTVTLYAPMLPQVVRQLSTPTMEGVEVEWTGAGWMLREALRVLSAGIPGGILTVAVAAAVLGVGVASLWRRSRLATLLMFLPVLVTLMAVVAAGHNLWPRFFFFAAAFIVVAAIRGGWVLVHWLVRWRPAAVATGGAAAVAAMSLLTVPRAWQPKQQFQAAYDFAEAERRPGDEVVALDIAYHVYFLQGKGGNWRFTSSLTMLGDAERSGPRTWVVYTLPARLRAVAPALFDYLAPPRYELIRTFPATVGGGEIHVLRHDATVHD